MCRNLCTQSFCQIVLYTYSDLILKSYTHAQATSLSPGFKKWSDFKKEAKNHISAQWRSLKLALALIVHLQFPLARPEHLLCHLAQLQPSQYIVLFKRTWSHLSYCYSPFTQDNNLYLYRESAKPMMDMITCIKISNINIIHTGKHWQKTVKQSLCYHSEGFLNKMSPKFKLFESFVVNSQHHTNQTKKHCFVQWC